MFDQFLVVAPALLMRSGSDGLAHHSIEVPFSFVLFASFNHFFEFDQEFNVFFIFFIVPVRSGICFFVVSRVRKAVNGFLGSKNPRFNLVDGHLVRIKVLGLSRAILREGKHHIHVFMILLKILLKLI